MIWIGVAALALVAWLSIALCFLALCRAAAQADKLMQRPAPTIGESVAVATSETGGTVIDLRAFLSSRTARPRATSTAARVAGP